MRNKNILLKCGWVALLSLGLQACLWQSGDDVVVVDSSNNCSRFENTQPHCQFPSPEDLVVLPDHRALIVSEFGDTGGHNAGALSLFSIASQSRRELFRGGDATLPEQRWGDENCVEPPGEVFSPHGLDLRRRADGKLQLLVVQHGGRESIEFFEVIESPEVNVKWRGCVIGPEDAQLNSVSSGPNGEFYTTKLLPLSASAEELTSVPTGVTGMVYRWTAAGGYAGLPVTAGAMPNGVVTSNDGKLLYVNYSASGLVKKFDLQDSRLLASVEVMSPDNIRWSADGKTLLVASLRAAVSDGDKFVKCMKRTIDICPIPFAIVELNPKTFEQTTLFENPQAPMGAGTVGLKVDDKLFIGSFSGNRMLQVDL